MPSTNLQNLLTSISAPALLLAGVAGCPSNEGRPETSDLDSDASGPACSEPRDAGCSCPHGAAGRLTCRAGGATECVCETEGDDVGDAPRDAPPRDTDPKDSLSTDDNLLANPSFEEGEVGDGCPSEWTCVTYEPSGAGTFSTDESTARHGDVSASWSGTGSPGTVLKQRLSARPGHRYGVTVWVKGDQLETAPFVQILFDRGDDLLADETFEASGSVGDWTRISGVTEPAPPGTDHVRFNLSTDDTRGTVWWDAASLVEAGDGGTTDADAGSDGTDGGDVDPGYAHSETIGGGEGYVDYLRSQGKPTFCGASSGDVVVQGETVDDLESAIASADSGDVVFVPGDMNIDMGFDARVDMPSGVTLASNRGCNGAPGARLYTDDKPSETFEKRQMFHVTGDDTRLTGLRLEGPYETQDELHPHEELENRGVVPEGVSIEIDNVELFNFMKAAIRPIDSVVHLHHSYLHHNNQNGWGYGISGPDWRSVVEYNRFDYNRHAIAGSGRADQGYVARYNVFGDSCLNGQQRMDQHGHPSDGELAGHKMAIYRNTVRDPRCSAVGIRGEPEETTPIHHNWFEHGEGDALSLGDGDELGEDHPTFDVHDNHYGETEPSCDVGAPRPTCD